MEQKKPILGVIGGTGLARIEGLTGAHPVEVPTPFGATSGPLLVGELRGTSVVFLARHGVGHRLQPRDIPYPANVWAMKELGVTHLVSLSAVGSLREDLPPGRLVLVNQFFDRTNAEPATFFDQHGLVVHCSFGEPMCLDLMGQMAMAARYAELNEQISTGGTYVCIAGPEFSTRAESEFFRRCVPNAAVVGMTALREARLAREAETHYGCIALVTDWDAWKDDAEPVTGEMVQRTIRENAGRAEAVVSELASLLSREPEFRCTCAETLAHGAIHTHSDHIPPQLRESHALLIAHRLPPIPAV